MYRRGSSSTVHVVFLMDDKGYDEMKEYIKYDVNERGF